MNVTLQIIGNLVNFAIFVFVLVKYAGPAVKKIVGDRHQATLAAIASADEAQRLAGEALAATRTRLANVDAELADLLNQARQLASAQGAALEETARADAERLRSQARSEIERERQAAVQAIRQAVLTHAFERATSELKAQMTPDRQRDLLDNIMQKVGDGSLALK